MANISKEIHEALQDIQSRVNANKELDHEDLELLFLSSLIEEEG